MAYCRGKALCLLCPVILLLSLLFENFSYDLFGHISHKYCEAGFAEIRLIFDFDGKEEALNVDQSIQTCFVRKVML